MESFGVGGRPCVADWGREIVEELQPELARSMEQGKGFRLVKEVYNGFHGTDLSKLLNDQGIKKVVLVGVAADICVSATAWAAMFHGFHTVVVSDGVGDVPDAKKNSLDRMMFVGKVMETNEIVNQWKKNLPKSEL